MSPRGHPKRFSTCAAIGTALVLVVFCCAAFQDYIITFPFFFGRLTHAIRPVLNDIRWIILSVLICVLFVSIGSMHNTVQKSRLLLKSAKGYLRYATGEYQHRVIARQHLGRDLKWYEVVHHINGETYDNRLSNLCVMHRNDHDDFHIWFNKVCAEEGQYPDLLRQKKILVGNFRGTLLVELYPQKK